MKSVIFVLVICLVTAATVPAWQASEMEVLTVVRSL
jgi:hypothetical protein